MFWMHRWAMVGGCFDMHTYARRPEWAKKKKKKKKKKGGGRQVQAVNTSLLQISISKK
jgi:hypothetical protein